MTYDPLNRITGLTAQASPDSGYLYQGGPTGNLIQGTELNGRSVTWNFDGIYRLTGESVSNDPANKNGSVSYNLDPVGNRSSETSSLAGLDPGSFTYNADDELAVETYDNNGNTTGSGGKAFAYDSQNHLISMTNGSTTATFVYDGDGNRVAKTVGGVTTRYLVDDLNPTGYPQVVEELVGGAVTRQYTYGLERISENQLISNVWTQSFYGYDGGGTVRQLTNSAGTVTDTYEYDAYGNHWTVEGSTPNNMLYQGEEWDPDLGLVHLRARYMNPLTGRFVSMDPKDGILTDPKTLHKYLYANGDPVDLKDPTGRAAAIGYALPIRLIQIPAILGEMAEAAAVACVLNKTAGLLGGLAKPGMLVSITQTLCSATVKKCRPCNPPVSAGDFGYQLHVGQKSPHFDKASQTWIPGGQTHWHLFQCNQSTPDEGCTCRWNKLRDMNGVGVTPPGFDVDTTSCSGVGIY
jgi:RHS repeat-associated protein